MRRRTEKGREGHTCRADLGLEQGCGCGLQEGAGLVHH